MKFTQSLQKNNFSMSSLSDFKIHLSYALDNSSPLGSRRGFTAPQGNNAIETSELLGFSFHDHAVGRTVSCSKTNNPPPFTTCQPSPQRQWTWLVLRLQLATPRPRPRDAHNKIPYFKRGPPTSDWDPDLLLGTPTRNTNPNATPSSTPIPAMTLTIARTAVVTSLDDDRDLQAEWWALNDIDPYDETPFSAILQF